MRYSEIVAPSTHPYVVVITIDPADLQSVERLTESRPELRLLGYDDSKPDHWAVRIGCASRQVANHLEEKWG